MKNYFYTTVLALALLTAYAVSQTGSYPSSSSPSKQPQGGAATMPPDASQSTSPSSNNPSSGTQKGTADQAVPQSDQTAPADDQTLTTKIQQQLATNPALSNVNVTVNNGVATLEGKVSSKQDRKEAKKLADAVPGVKSVKDKLTVEASSTSTTNPPSPNPHWMSPQASTPPNNSGSISGNAQTGSSSSTSTTPPSSSTSSGTASQESGGASTSSGSQSSSQTGSSTSQSSGQTGSSSGMPQSDTSAASTDSSTLQTQIQNALKNEPTLANDNINVSVTDSTVELTGTANSKKERQAAKRIAQSFANNRKVQDHITVAGSSSSSTGNSTTSPATTPPNTTAPNQNPSNPNQQSQPYPH